jgi:ligand-binding SRPBCC domain-containing protein
MKPYVLEREQIIERGRPEAFAFFSDAFNLERITPPFLRFRVLTARPVTMAAGTLLEYKLSLFGVRFRWKTIIEEWEPDESFVDSQLEGPYRLWRHTHSFEPIGQSRTLMRDRVEYLIPLGFLGRVGNALIVSRTLKEIFDYRARAIAGLLAAR